MYINLCGKLCFIVTVGALKPCLFLVFNFVIRANLKIKPQLYAFNVSLYTSYKDIISSRYNAFIFIMILNKIMSKEHNFVQDYYILLLPRRRFNW